MEFPVARNFANKIHSELGTNRILGINWKHAAIICVVILAGIPTYLIVKYLKDQEVRRSAMTQAEVAQKKGDVDLALRHVDRYLANNPIDIEMLGLKAEILSKVQLPKSQLLDAARALDQLVRLDPKGPKGDGRLGVRRQLADLYIQYSDDLKSYAETIADPEMERKQSLYTSAASIAKQLVEEAANKKTPDPVAHRLLARAYEGQITEVPGPSTSRKNDTSGATKKVILGEAEDLWRRAIQNYQKAIQLDPSDLDSSTRLANLYLTWGNDPASADTVLDAMLQANPKSVEARLVRYRAFSLSKREDRAQEELDAILQLAPDNVEVRLNIAQVALGKRKPLEARKQLDAIPADKQDDLRVKILRGYMEFAEQHPDDAIDQWRRGLLLVGGSDQDLTWKLAFNLVQMKRYAQAEPLRQQYIRLSNGDKSGIGKFLDALFDIGYGRLVAGREKLEKIKDIVNNTYKADVLLTLGRCCDMMGDTDAALLAYRNAASVAPLASAPRLAIARHLEKRQPDDAVNEVDRALAESPDEVFLLQEAIRLRLVSMAYRPQPDSRRTKEIEDLFARLQAVSPTNPTLQLYQSEYLALTGKIDQSVKSLRQSLTGENRKLPELWINLAMGLDRLNPRDTTESLRVLDEAALPENVGDRVKIRIAKARLLSKAGKGQLAREVLTQKLDSIKDEERADLAQARGELLRELGDRDGAIAAFAEWAQLAPNLPGPALSLLTMGQVDYDDRAAKLGMEALQKIGGDREPYGIAASILSLLRPEPNRGPAPPADRLYDAEKQVVKLRENVPSLRFGSFLQGMILEFKKDIPGAIKAYRMAMKDDLLSPALPKLIGIYVRTKRFNELADLKREFDKEVQARQRPGLSAEFDRLVSGFAAKLSAKDYAEYLAAKLVDNRGESMVARAEYAWMLDRNNEPGLAEETLRDLIKEKPNEPGSWLNLINFQANRRTKEDVARTIGQARREYHGDRPELFLALCYWFGQDIPKASEAFARAVEKQPNDVTTLRTLVEFYEKNNQQNLVDPVLRKVLKIDPSTAWATRMLALSLSARLDPATWPEAWALVAPGAPGSGETPEDRLIRATVLARSPDVRNREESVSLFRNLVNDLPISSPLAIDTRIKLSQAMIDVHRYPEAWDAVKPVADDQARPNSIALMLAIEALCLSSQPDEAQVRLDRLIAIDPKSSQVGFGTALVLTARGKIAEAVAALEGVYKQFSKEPTAQSIGLIAFDRIMKLGDLDAALRMAKTLSSRWPADAWTLASVHVARKEYNEALVASEQAIEAGSAREGFRYALGAAMFRRNDPEFIRKTRELGEKARAKTPRDFNIPILLATVYHFEDRFEDELACYRAALELYPNNVQFLNNMAWTLSEGLNRPQEAIKYIQEAIRREGEHPQHLDTRGVIEERLGQYDQAIADLEKSIEGNPSGETYYHLARVYLKAGKKAESRTSRDLAIKAKFDPSTIDQTDRRDLKPVMEQP